LIEGTDAADPVHLCGFLTEADRLLIDSLRFAAFFWHRFFEKSDMLICKICGQATCLRLVGVPPSETAAFAEELPERLRMPVIGIKVCEQPLPRESACDPTERAYPLGPAVLPVRSGPALS